MELTGNRAEPERWSFCEKKIYSDPKMTANEHSFRISILDVVGEVLRDLQASMTKTTRVENIYRWCVLAVGYNTSPLLCQYWRKREQYFTSRTIIWSPWRWAFSKHEKIQDGGRTRVLWLNIGVAPTSGRRENKAGVIGRCFVSRAHNPFFSTKHWLGAIPAFSRN